MPSLTSPGDPACSRVFGPRTLSCMRWSSLLFSSLLASAACGDDHGDPTACEVGPDILQAATSRVRDAQPTCTRDEDCVLIGMDVTCPGFKTSGCGESVHRDAAARWNAAEVCREIDRASVPGAFQCGFEASCLDPGKAVCRDGACTGEKLP